MHVLIDQLKGWLKDPLWQSLGAFSAFGALVAAIIGIYVQRRRKALSYDVVANTRLLSMEEEIGGSLQILFQGTSVTKVRLVSVRLENTGNVPVLPSDFIEPIGIRLKGGGRILTADVAEANPKNVRPEVQLSSALVSIKPILLNRRDFFVVKMIAAECDGDLEVDARIAGVKSIGRIRESPLSILLIIAGIVVSIFGVLRTLPPTAAVHSWYFLLFFIGYSMMIAGTLTGRRGARVVRAVKRLFT